MANTHVEQVFPPGEILREELETRGWSQTDLAEILGRPAKLVNEIIAGKRAITPETAQGLADALGTSAALWLNLESQFQLSKAKKPDAAVARRARLFELAPVKEMQRRGWIDDTDDPYQLEGSLCRFFEVASLEQIRTLPHAAKKSTDYDEDATPSQRAWVQYIRRLGESTKAAPFTDRSVRQAIQNLRSVVHSREEIRHVPRILADAGIRLVIVEPLAGTRIDGVCVWLDDARPVIGLSLRLDRIDSFWFALMHECGHVHARDGLEHPIVDIDLVGDGAIRTSDKPESEQRADQFAAESLIPAEELNGFIARVAPLFSKERIKGFAARLKVHPGIVVGQLQHREQIKYSHSREMLEKVRSIVTGSALTDGWAHHSNA
jgi:HTH-type transcriptional regulator / antitoxin HigA